MCFDCQKSPPGYGEEMTELKFTDVYLSNKFNPCPCGHFFGGEDGMKELREHFNNGHFEKDHEAGKKDPQQSNGDK